MKRIIYILISAFIVVLFLSLLIKPLVLRLIKQQLERIFVNSTVLIRDYSLKPAHQLSLFDIQIKNEPIYSIKVKEMTVQYNLSSLLKGSISKFYLKDAAVSINTPQQSILGLHQYLHFGIPAQGIFTIKDVKFSNLNLALKSKELSLQAELSVVVNLPEQLLNYLNLKVDSCDSRDFHLKNAFLNVSQNQSAGSLSIYQIQYNKLNIDQLKAQARLKDKLLFLDDLSAQAFSGKIQGDFGVTLDENNGYFLNLKFINLDAEAFVEDFNLNEKVKMSGKLAGQLTLQGKGLDFQVINGDFSDVAGGILTIKDTKFLENVARSSQQPLDLLVESFKDYHYNKAVMRLYLEEGDLNFNIAMDSEAGKRNLSITVHDLKLGRREGI